MQQTSEVIPPLAHFIWAGGVNPMVIDGVSLVSEWTKSAQGIEGFQSWLWIDKKTASQTVVDDYKSLFRSHGIIVLDEEEVQSMDRQQLLQITPPPVILKDIAKNKLRNEFVEYEIEKLRPNYGSSSDLLRYEILFNFGGFYCDCSDVGIGKTPLITIFNRRYDRPVVFLDHCPQQPNASDEKLATFGINELGNDTFAASARNISFLKMIIQARKNYDLPADNISIHHIVLAHSGNNIKDTTIGRTGPGLVRQVLIGEMGCKEESGLLVSKDRKVEVHRIRDGMLQLTTPSSNTGNWLNMRITRHENLEIAINALINTIIFEANHSKILRLDDHIKDFMESTGNKLNVKQTLDALDDTIKKVAGMVKYVQLTGQFNETIEYASKLGFLNIFQLQQANVCIQAINSQAYLNDFIRVERTANQMREGLREQASQKSLSVEGLILSTQRPEVMKSLCLQIKLGLDYVGCIAQHLDKFHSNVRQEIRSHLIERLHRYQEYAPLLSSIVGENKYQIDMSIINSLLQELNPQQQSQQSLDSSFRI